MDFILMARIVFVTAMINIVSLLMVVFTCRCMNIWGFNRGLNKQGWYKKVFSWHCWLWYIFLPSVILHAVLAIWLMGIPF